MNNNSAMSNTKNNVEIFLIFFIFHQFPIWVQLNCYFGIMIFRFFSILSSKIFTRICMHDMGLENQNLFQKFSNLFLLFVWIMYICRIQIDERSTYILFRTIIKSPVSSLKSHNISAIEICNRYAVVSARVEIIQSLYRNRFDRVLLAKT